MSSNLECLFFEYLPNEWYYALETDFGDDHEAWDWREDARAYGPFHSKAEANEHLRDNHQNPGGSSCSPYDPQSRGDNVIDKLVADAASNMERFKPTGYSRRF